MEREYVEDLDELPPATSTDSPPSRATAAEEDLDEDDVGLHIDGVDGIEDDDYTDAPLSGCATMASPGNCTAAPPRALKRWLLPPSLTPKLARARTMPPVPVTFDFGAKPSEDGVWRCAVCSTAYESRTGLFAHARFCAGREAPWACEWCRCSESETSQKSSGPNGIKTLCSACGQRYRHGANGMPAQNERGEWLCSGCGRGFPSMTALGGHRRHCDGGVWRCDWCDCRQEESTGKGPGPAGAMTLCSACSARFRAGHTGPPARNDDGKYVCERCERTFETISGLGSHRKRCDGGSWRCAWCECSKDDCSGKGPGPTGGGSLCALCSARWKGGHTGPPAKNAAGRYPCDRCERTFESFRALGVHGRDCDGGAWRCAWCACKAEETAGKSPGPDGPRTLCSACASRHRAGHMGPPSKNDQGR